MQFPLPPLAQGEIYIASLFDAEKQAGYHLVLLPGDNDDANWQTQTDWAAGIGGELPTRVEQALMFATSKEAFKETGYWSNETHASDAGYAWCQDFNYGNQGGNHKSHELRARAVRRLIIQ